VPRPLLDFSEWGLGTRLPAQILSNCEPKLITGMARELTSISSMASLREDLSRGCLLAEAGAVAVELALCDDVYATMAIGW